jgi:cob(I)alamin adenosyltransferase
MVRLTRIYTRTGDAGMTRLGDGARVPKTHARIAAYGTVDELNAVMGMAARREDLPPEDRTLLRRIQNDLFDVGADLCVPMTPQTAARLRVAASQVEDLERAIDARNRTLAPLRSFVLPGGSEAGAWLHLARVVCRRAELAVVRVVESEPGAVGAHVLPYINRLSDLLFVMARCANDLGRADVLWAPGAGQAPSAPPTGTSGRRVVAAGTARRGAPRPGRRRTRSKPRRRM